MKVEEQFVDAQMRSWKQNVDRFEAFFAPLTDEQLEAEIAPGRNRLIYLLGHIVAVHDRMLPLLGIGERRHADLDDAFLANPDRTHSSPVSAATLKEMLTETNGALSSAFEGWTASDWLARHTAVSEEDFAKEPHRNRLSVFLSRNIHLAFHYGQVILVKPEADAG